VPNWSEELRGSKTYGGADLSGDPRMARDPRNPALANNRMPQMPMPYPQNPMQPSGIDPDANMDEAMKAMDSGQQQPGTMQDARRQGAQQQPGASRLIQILRMLGIM